MTNVTRCPDCHRLTFDLYRGSAGERTCTTDHTGEER